jgi:transcriptional regulator with XRE-family HTH domain
MPRLAAPDPLSEAIGRRVRGLRTELGLTQEKLAFESETISKGHLSDLEKGLLRPTVHTLKGVADRLGVQLLDLVTFPEEGPRQALVDATRALTPAAVAELLRDARQALRLAPPPPLARRDPTPAVAPFKTVLPRARDRFVTCVPLLGLDVAAGGFEPAASDRTTAWVVPSTRRKLRPGMFVARVVGRSMEPRIPDGAWCLFAANPAGDLAGRTLLVQHRGIHDADTGTSYTVKRLERDGDGAVRLLPENPDYTPIELRDRDAADLRVVAELVEVLTP